MRRNDDIEIIGTNICYYRKEKKLTLAQFAELAGSANTYIGSIERGEINFTIETLEKLCSGLEIDVDNLFSQYGYLHKINLT